jgi:hypothetical protein
LVLQSASAIASNAAFFSLVDARATRRAAMRARAAHIVHVLLDIHVQQLTATKPLSIVAESHQDA